MGLVLYPFISNWLYQRSASRVIDTYIDLAGQYEMDKIEEELDKARAYNDALTSTVIEDPFIPGTGYVLPENYTSVLNIDGVIGYVEIPKIDEKMPIYHRTSEEVLKKE